MVPFADLFNHKSSILSLSPEYTLEGACLADGEDMDDEDIDDEEGHSDREGPEEEEGKSHNPACM